MSKSIDWGFPLLMLACAVLGFVLATAVVKKDYAARLERQRIDSQVDKAKAHMTTILQLNDCYTNEAFYTLDREIFEIKKKLETAANNTSNGDYASRALKTIHDYYLRFGMHAECEECVPRSPTPELSCTEV